MKPQHAAVSMRLVVQLLLFPTLISSWTVPSIATSRVSSSRLFLAKNPHFAQQAHVSTTTSSTIPQKKKNAQQQQKKNNPTIKKTKHNRYATLRSDTLLGTQHAERLARAGRQGTPGFQDPCRVFIGNIDLSATSEDLAEWICQQHALPAYSLLVSAQVVYDWKTQQSKGFGFVRYQEEIQATVALTQFHGRVWNNRKIAIQPANLKQKNADELERRHAQYLEREEKRQNAGKVQVEPPPPLVIEPEEAQMLKALDPDLLQGVVIRGQEGTVVTTTKKTRHEDDEHLNRENRRKAERKRPKRKPVSNGFG